MRRLFGERWEAMTTDYRAFLKREMEIRKDSNPLSAVIPAAKAMSAAGENPTLLMAVAVDMADKP